MSHKSVKSLIIAPVHYEKYLKKELAKIDFENIQNTFAIYDDIDCKNILWQNTSWQEVQTLNFSSIKEGAEKLKAIAPHAYYQPFQFHRRATLIQSHLKNKPPPRIDFYNFQLPKRFCEWTLLDKNTILYTTKPLHPYPLGRLEFVENKKEPPTRAYLKLWEVFSFHLPLPSQKERCIDLGSSPGGWTWFLSQYFSHVTSVDSADLKIKTTDNVRFLKKDAFRIKNFEDYDYLFSDMACEPEKLYRLVIDLIKNSPINTFVCTIKLSDKKEEKEIIEKFFSIEKSKVVHLYQNKHELTWIYSSKFSIA